jgi:hypothetical protein
MTEAVANYAAYRESPDAWMLGRFIVSAAGLGELADAVRTGGHSTLVPWRVSALAGDDVAADADRIGAFNAAHASALLVDVVEARAADGAQVATLAAAFGDGCALYVEIPPAEDPRPLLEAVRKAGARAKIRTGGVTETAFPTSARLARFIASCAELAVPFKATAGLHHPLRGEHPVTYEANAPRATMFCYLNVFVAGAIAASGAEEDELVMVLEEREPSAFTFGADGLRWRSRRVELDHLAVSRTAFAIAFGSCSFREPVDELRELALL